MPKRRKRGDSTTSAALSLLKDTTTCMGVIWRPADIRFLSALMAAVRYAEPGMARTTAKCIISYIADEVARMTSTTSSGQIKSATAPSTSGRCGRPSKREGWRREIRTKCNW